MKFRGIFLLFILSSFGLISLYIYFFAKPLYLKQLEEDRISKIQKVCMKKNSRKRDRSFLLRDVTEADKKIQEILKNQPIYFKNGSILLDTNNSGVLVSIIDILKNMNEDVVMSISAYTESNGSPIQNLKLSQKRADTIKEYFLKRAELMLVTAIGYGEEFPLTDKADELINRRIEINLIRIKK
jgi:outer membrane protein OmpA-like peptidoglycan-associated protein